MNLHRTIVGISALLAIHSAQAGPPFVTDDPEPPPPGGWEINVPFILGRSAGNAKMNAPLFDFNYGLPDVQLKLEFPVAIVAQWWWLGFVRSIAGKMVGNGVEVSSILRAGL
jgi:hypothetical protein